MAMISQQPRVAHNIKTRLYMLLAMRIAVLSIRIIWYVLNIRIIRYTQTWQIRIFTGEHS